MHDLRAASVRGAAAVLLTLTAAPAFAQTFTWNLNGVVFADGGTVAGFITYTHNAGDPFTSTIADWNVAVAGSTNPALPDFVYTPATSDGVVLDFSPACAQPTLTLSAPAFGNLPDRRDLRVTPAATLDGTADTIAIDTSAGCFESLECTNCGNTRLITGGSLTTLPVADPVPSLPGKAARALAVLLLLTGAWTIRRRDRSRASGPVA